MLTEIALIIPESNPTIQHATFPLKILLLQTTGDYNYFASGLSYNSGNYALSSCDGTILTFTKDTTSQCKQLSLKHTGDFETTWSCYGVSLSNCGLFSAAAFKPSNICEDRQLRPGTLLFLI
jgi:hypothetical protein